MNHERMRRAGRRSLRLGDRPWRRTRGRGVVVAGETDGKLPGAAPAPEYQMPTAMEARPTAARRARFNRVF
jgi:hypothetical protein